MLTDLLFSFVWVFGFFFLAGGIAWLADQLVSFHLDGMARVRRLEEKERERGRKMIITYQRNQAGAWVLSAFVGEGAGEYLLTRSYYDYTKRQAGEMFREEIRKAS